MRGGKLGVEKSRFLAILLNSVISGRSTRKIVHTHAPFSDKIFPFYTGNCFLSFLLPNYRWMYSYSCLNRHDQQYWLRLHYSLSHVVVTKLQKLQSFSPSH